MHPKPKAKVHAFASKSEAETELKRLRNITKLVLKSKNPAKDKITKLIKDLEVVASWYDWHARNGPKFDRYDMKSARKDANSAIKKLKDL